MRSGICASACHFVTPAKTWICSSSWYSPPWRCCRRIDVGMATTGLEDQSGSGSAPATLPAPGPYWPYTNVGSPVIRAYASAAYTADASLRVRTWSMPCWRSAIHRELSPPVTRKKCRTPRALSSCAIASAAMVTAGLPLTCRSPGGVRAVVERCAALPATRASAAPRGSVVGSIEYIGRTREAPRLVVPLPWFRLGYVIPHLYTDLDAYLFYAIAPDGAMLVTTQLNLSGYSLAAVENELPTFWQRVDLLASKRADVIALSGVPIASVLGRTRVREMIDEMEQRTGRPCSTDLEAHISALEHFGVERLALGTRWPDHVVEALVGYLREAGIVCVRQERGDLERNKSQDPAEAHELALRLGREALQQAPEAQALMLPGGLWFAVNAVPILEAEFGKPVTINIGATLRNALLRYPGALPERPDPRWGMVLS